MDCLTSERRVESRFTSSNSFKTSYSTANSVNQQSNEQNCGAPNLPPTGVTLTKMNLQQTYITANKTSPPSGRVSSVLQKASGAAVVISEEAKRKSEAFMQQSAATAEKPSAPSDENPASAFDFVAVTGPMAVRFMRKSPNAGNLRHSLVTPRLDRDALLRVLCGAEQENEQQCVWEGFAQDVVSTARVSLLALISSATAVRSLISADSLLLARAQKSVGSWLIQQVLERLGAPNSADQEMRQWLNWQVKWVAWTLASAERRAPDLNFGLYSERNIVDCVAWRFSVYSTSQSGASRSGAKATKRVVFEVDAASSGQPSAKCAKYGRSPSALQRPPPSRRRHVDAATHFAQRGSMSPLQRCSDIRCLLGPVTVCVAVDDSTDTPCCEATDGWWWVRLSLDDELLRRVKQVPSSCCRFTFILVIAALSAGCSPRRLQGGDL